MKANVWIKAGLALLWSCLLLWAPGRVLAQGSDYPLVEAPNSAGGPDEPMRFVGNYCTVFGGISLHDEDDRAFVVDVPGRPVAAYLYWAGRDRATAAGDDTILVGHNGGPLTPATATVALTAESPNNFRWFTYSYDALQDVNPLIQSGLNELRVTGLTIDERHGVGAVVIYENDTHCPYQQIDLIFGNDVFFKGWSGASGPNSAVTCVDFPPPPAPIEIDFQMFVGGIESPLRSDAIWYATGRGPKPTDLVDQPFAIGLDEQLAGLSGNEFDNYDTFVQDLRPFMVGAGDTWSCVQIESPEPANPDKTMGVSAAWINLTVRTPLASIHITPDGVNPLNDPHVFTVTVESSVGFDSMVITPTVEPAPTSLEHTCATPLIDGAFATCTVTINSSIVGTFTATARASIDLGSVIAEVVTNGRGNSSLPAVKEYVEGPAIDIEKATNGEDADDPTGPLIPVDGAVAWTYVVTNIGNVPLVDVVVTDDQGVAVTCPQETLAVGASMTCTGAGVATVGQYANIGAVTGVSPEGQTVSDQDPSHYLGYIPASLGDRVFGDSDPDGTTPEQILAGNGIQDEGERGVDGIIVQLYNANDELIAETVTDNGGFYQFTGLVPGDYYVVFINPLGEGLWTIANSGEDNAIDSDGDSFIPITVDTGVEGDAIRTELISLEPGEFDRTWDAGLVGLSTLASSGLGDRVWLDTDKDGLQDDLTAEPGIAGVPVRLYTVADNGSLTLLAEMVTGEFGDYLFDALDPGKYVVEFVLPEDYTVSPLTAGGDDALDSDAEHTTGRTVSIFLPSHMLDRTWDAGIFATPTAIDETEEPDAPTHAVFLPMVTWSR